MNYYIHYIRVSIDCLQGNLRLTLAGESVSLSNSFIQYILLHMGESVRQLLTQSVVFDIQMTKGQACMYGTEGWMSVCAYVTD